MGKIIPFTGITKLDLDPDTVLENLRGELESVVIIGYDRNGYEFFASNLADGATINWLIDRCKLALLDGLYSEE